MTLPDFAPGTIGLIWAEAHGGVIGHDGDMPWHAPADMAHFKATTMGHPVVMGRRTWESIPAKFRPFEGRTNYVLTRDADVAAEVRAAGGFVFESLDEALAAAADAPGGDVIWVVGGGSVYAAAIAHASVAVITRFDLEVEGDTFAPALPGDFVQLTSEPPAGFETPAKGPAHRFEVWARV